ncbi:C-C chemokine receptor type 4-like isoform X3 [Channa argus]|uniref:C-C chemokine receptor type 4-like isoform X3 n=1 Tax=Channa argus TaxID=215402 RepID=UPI003521D74D
MKERFLFEFSSLGQENTIRSQIISLLIDSMNMSENSTTDYGYDYMDNCEQSHAPETAILHYMLFCLGVLGNITVLWVLLRYMKLKTMTDVCLLNLALSDLVLAVSLPIWVYSFQDLVSCKLITGVYQLGFYSGTLFVTLMSVDRYLAMRARTLRYGITASITVWVISIIMAIPQVIFATLEMQNDNSSQCQPLYPEDSQRFWKMLRNFSENTANNTEEKIIFDGLAEEGLKLVVLTQKEKEDTSK